MSNPTGPLPDAASEIAAPPVPGTPPAGPLLPPVPPAARVASLIEIFLCSGLPTQLLVGILLMAGGIPPLARNGDLSFTHVVLVALIDTAIVTWLAAFFLRLRGESARDVFLGRRARLREAALGLALVPLVFLLVAAAAYIIQSLTPWLHNVPTNPLEALLSDPWRVAIMLVVVAVGGGFREEVQRAFILHRFEQHLGGAMVGLVIFSAAFGLGHMLQGYDAVVLTALLGTFWGLVYLRRRSIVAPVVSHAVFNIIQVLFHGSWT